jgi:hypothetical protein
MNKNFLDIAEQQMEAVRVEAQSMTGAGTLMKLASAVDAIIQYHCEQEKADYGVRFVLPPAKPPTTSSAKSLVEKLIREWPGDHTCGHSYSSQCTCKECRVIRLSAQLRYDHQRSQIT